MLYVLAFRKSGMDAPQACEGCVARVPSHALLQSHLCGVERAPCLCAVRNAVLGNLGGQLVRQHLRYEATVQLVVRGAGTLRGRATLNVRPRVLMALNEHRGARRVAQRMGYGKQSLIVTGSWAATGSRRSRQRFT